MACALCCPLILWRSCRNHKVGPSLRKMLQGINLDISNPIVLQMKDIKENEEKKKKLTLAILTNNRFLHRQWTNKTLNCFLKFLDRRFSTLFHNVKETLAVLKADILWCPSICSTSMDFKLTRWDYLQMWEVISKYYISKLKLKDKTLE